MIGWRGNYLEGTPNPFGLAGPPAWFCAELYAFDAELVIFPSAEIGAYRVARRTDGEGMAPIMTPAGERPHGEYRPDQRVYVNHKLLPITTLLPFTSWSPVVLQDLCHLSFQRQGGWKACADRLDQFDEDQQRRLEQETYDGADSLGHMSWWGSQFKTGGAVDLGATRREGARTTDTRHAQPAYRPLNFAGGAAAFVGDKAPARTTAAPAKAYVAPEVDMREMVGAGPRPAKRSILWTP